jgi:hypothetical protein
VWWGSKLILRKQHDVADFSGDLVEDAAVAECISQARQLLVLTQDWLQLQQTLD